MLIIISPDELETEFRNKWKLGLISNLSIDFADNAIWASFENKEIIIFKFHNWGYVLDNRWCSYTITAGQAGILINLINKDIN